MSGGEALPTLPSIGAGERAHWFVPERLPDLDCLSATFMRHAYPPHGHDTWVIGTVTRGCEIWSARGTGHATGPGGLLFIRPHDIHDGRPAENGYSYRMSYPGEAFLERLATDLGGQRPHGSIAFHDTTVQDPEAAAAFARAHAALERDHDRFGAEEAMTRAYALLLVRHAGVAEARLGRETGPVARARALIEALPDADLSLARLAAQAGLSTHHLIRAFRRETGATPHAHVVGVRVERAKARLRAGEAPAEVAAAVGFADQAHLTRAFKARLGVTPAAYRRATAPARSLHGDRDADFLQDG